MSNLVEALRYIVDSDVEFAAPNVNCPGCEYAHRIANEALEKHRRNTIDEDGITVYEERGKIFLVKTVEARKDELENAYWLRKTPSGLMAAVLGGGNPKGLHIALSSIPTDVIHSIFKRRVECKG